MAKELVWTQDEVTEVEIKLDSTTAVEVTLIEGRPVLTALIEGRSVLTEEGMRRAFQTIVVPHMGTSEGNIKAMEPRFEIVESKWELKPSKVYQRKVKR